MTRVVDAWDEGYRAGVHATHTTGAVRPMPGWRNLGTPTKPVYRISEADLIAWINDAPQA